MEPSRHVEPSRSAHSCLEPSRHVEPSRSARHNATWRPIRPEGIDVPRQAGIAPRLARGAWRLDSPGASLDQESADGRLEQLRGMPQARKCLIRKGKQDIPDSAC